MQKNFQSSNIWQSFHVPMPARREHLSPLVKGSHVPMVVYIIGLFYAQSTLSGSGIVFWCSVYYPPFDLVVDSFILQLPNKFWQFGTLFSVFGIVHRRPMSRIPAFESLRSGSNVELNSSILSDHLCLVNHILFATVSIQGTLILCANTGLHLFLCFRIKDSSIVSTNPLLHVRHAAVWKFDVMPIDFAMKFIPHWKWFVNCPQELIPKFCFQNPKKWRTKVCYIPPSAPPVSTRGRGPGSGPSCLIILESVSVSSCGEGSLVGWRRGIKLFFWWWDCWQSSLDPQREVI